MKEFEDMGKVAEHLIMLSAGAFVLYLHEGLEEIGKLVEKRAKAQIGNYQAAAGPFSAWPELADSTKEERARLGYTPNDPLLRNGALRASISHEAVGLEVAVGSPSEIMLWQELGTATIPARSDLGTAMFNSKDPIMRILGRAAAIGVAGGQRLPGTVTVGQITNP